MSTLETVTEALGWCTAINIGLLAVAALILVSMRDLVISIHRKMFSLNEETLSCAYLQYLAQYKIAILVLNLVPYIALKATA